MFNIVVGTQYPRLVPESVPAICHPRTHVFGRPSHAGGGGVGCGRIFREMQISGSAKCVIWYNYCKKDTLGKRKRKIYKIPAHTHRWSNDPPGESVDYLGAERTENSGGGGVMRSSAFPRTNRVSVSFSSRRPPASARFSAFVRFARAAGRKIVAADIELKSS